ncbi:nitroreductase family deazaflavin-dependent oxidoreductase [Amycolatopsis mongoliensis]|uniref:Nitroreductase family deazaflavin-dependent oxidoreductase n=1 Tax=Amycolatopsis mongoliensis TaxID=715475 RepID=A0A9Y2JP89_9PSEU|nr:nitroreductase family deazaflavin-dependent oxidoreductase [Amycolatopsis sp. 4-36]WIY00499.1 nitroreductase family deazaflavin-dependent oxidoreductase [Amycolatopsis sp. 4-36]
MSTKEPVRPAQKPRSVKDVVRQFNKHVLNPVMLVLAGRKHWYASAIEHVGRRTGRRYTTPVVAGRVPDGFIVPLPYGTGVDWLRNVLKAGTATLRSAGVTYVVTDPHVVDADAAFTQVSPRYAQAWCRFGITEYLKLTIDREA